MAGSTDGNIAGGASGPDVVPEVVYSCASRYFSVSAAKPFNSLTSAFSQSFVAGAIPTAAPVARCPDSSPDYLRARRRKGPSHPRSPPRCTRGMRPCGYRRRKVRASCRSVRRGWCPARRPKQESRATPTTHCHRPLQSPSRRNWSGWSRGSQTRSRRRETAGRAAGRTPQEQAQVGRESARAVASRQTPSAITQGYSVYCRRRTARCCVVGRDSVLCVVVYPLLCASTACRTQGTVSGASACAHACGRHRRASGDAGRASVGSIPELRELSRQRLVGGRECKLDMPT
jgi:hypothetical protein